METLASVDFLCYVYTFVSHNERVATSNERKEKKCTSEGKMRILHLKRAFLITET
jgi:hypothetical protein